MIPKFRVFCERHKCIEEVYQITYLGDNDIKVEAECLSGYIGSDFILMQSTGLHDNTKFEDLSNEEREEWLESGKTADEWQGREIFEGDIVKYSDYGYKFTGTVTQDSVSCWWIEGIDPDDNLSFGDVTDYNDYTCYVEVIGNRYMNPELLEET